MNTIDILIEGYAKITSNGWDASSSCTLIVTNSGKKIIADPGANRDLLFEQLKKRSLSLEDIDMVFITHHHLDHAMNVGLFPNAKVIDEEAVYTQAVAVEGVQMLPDTDISVIATPGHEYAHAILIVPTKDGTVVVAGDTFWWTSTEEQVVNIEKPDDFAEKMEELKASRKVVLDLADWVIPGHGKMFQNKK
ncbi:MAG TPA: MBL fold metallo-hydrolase [Candidatus Eisenbacteria bacterium]|nr:MBL fold metallo-hydrolase [Candidatus Eisenbacteria bacterium]